MSISLLLVSFNVHTLSIIVLDLYIGLLLQIHLSSFCLVHLFSCHILLALLSHFVCFFVRDFGVLWYVFCRLGVDCMRAVFLVVCCSVCCAGCCFLWVRCCLCVIVFRVACGCHVVRGYFLFVPIVSCFGLLYVTSFHPHCVLLLRFLPAAYGMSAQCL